MTVLLLHDRRGVAVAVGRRDLNRRAGRKAAIWRLLRWCSVLRLLRWRSVLLLLRRRSVLRLLRWRSVLRLLLRCSVLLLLLRWRSVLRLRIVATQLGRRRPRTGRELRELARRHQRRHAFEEGLRARDLLEPRRDAERLLLAIGKMERHRAVVGEAAHGHLLNGARIELLDPQVHGLRPAGPEAHLGPNENEAAVGEHDEVGLRHQEQEQTADEQELHHEARLTAHVRDVKDLLSGLQDLRELALEVLVLGRHGGATLCGSSPNVHERGAPPRRVAGRRAALFAAPSPTPPCGASSEPFRSHSRIAGRIRGFSGAATRRRIGQRRAPSLRVPKCVDFCGVTRSGSRSLVTP